MARARRGIRAPRLVRVGPGLAGAVVGGALVGAALAGTIRPEMAAAQSAPAAARTAPVVARDTPRLTGFSEAGAARQRALEARFLAVPSPEGAEATGRWLTAEPHFAGTARQATLAGRLGRWLSDRGFDVEIEPFDVHTPHPDSLALELVAPEAHTFRLREEEGSGSDDFHSWSWNAYSANGTARAPVVYAGYGTAVDYALLREHGVDVDGAIVLVRYGGVYRGTKVREAEKRGAAGVVLFPDPADGGFVDGDTLPDGPYRPDRAVQRGTASYLWRYTGDPLTPGRPSVPGVPRLDPAAAPDLPRIPVLNITGEQGRRVLEALEGPAPEALQGGWPIPYRTGPGPAELRMTVRQDFAPRRIRNVLARIPGREDQTVIVGVHYDAWVRGGVDPQSGVGAVLELARGLAALRETGWRPRRSILLALWDAEELGAVGSTEFVEARREWLEEHAVAYLNVDVLTAGTLDVSGSPSLRDLVLEAAVAVEDPHADGTLADGWRERWAGDPRLRPLGVGSDWTAFFHFAGIPSLQWTMNGRGHYTVYHSGLDDFDYLRTHADSALLYTPRMAAVMGLATLRLAEAEALPFDYVRYARRIREMVDSVAAQTAERASSAPRDASLERLRRAVGELEEAAAKAEERRRAALATGDDDALGRLNRTLPRVERAFLADVPTSLPSDGGRQEARDPPLGVPVEGAAHDWYRHLVFTSDAATGYGAVPVPSLQPERLDDGRARAPTVAELTRALLRAADLLRAAPR